ncbi:GRB2-associated-binding protein 3-like isoform X2 [Biomphalaria glabrata]|uniref:GRB2-associated-binding protein 3-like isoform X2 n=1 Tax=Biomphalaria glabrata TaxID=6526 RepID=A0A9W3B100_BIOGL|nr:GRB2-associated-binding protein 3-like isoform X2 [Biomphalaria glabrata]
MKRRKPTKMTNVVHSGWMTKSPPEKRLTSTFRIFRAQWKRRFFVLSKPLGSLPDQYELDYYKDEHCSSKKGSIDLEQCEQIIEALDSESFPNLLAIKTVCKNKSRTYYLAADTEPEMNSWVQWLCHVCGLRPEDQHIPEPKPPLLTVQNSVSNGRPASPPTPVTKTTTLPAQMPQSISVSQQITKQTSSDSSSASYIPLENCTTGQPQATTDKRFSVESVPDFLAPSPPQKQSKLGMSAPSASEDEVFLQEDLQNHVPAPESKFTQGSDLYQVPPVRPPKGRKRTEEGPDSSYDVPPLHFEHSPRLSVGNRRDSGSGDGRASTPECYDYPPPRLDSTTSSDSEIPPERPPKPSHLQSPYQNLPPAGKSDSDLNTVLAAPKSIPGRMVSGYDIPRSAHRPVRPTQSALAATVPVRQQRGTTSHAYFNTQGARPNSGELNKSGEDQKFPIVPPPRGADVADDRSSSSSSLYQYPPSSSGAPVPPSRPPARGNTVAPATIPRNPDSNNTATGQEDNAPIFSTHRTRSFKRNNVVANHGSPNLNQHSHGLTMLVPPPRPVPQKPKDASSMEDEESIISKLKLKDTEEETHHSLSLLHSIPAPTPDLEMDRELKYIDLALPDSAQDTPRPTHGHSHHAPGHSHGHSDRGKEIATEYREIDFIKTQALSDAKKVKEKERKNDDHN